MRHWSYALVVVWLVWPALVWADEGFGDHDDLYTEEASSEQVIAAPDIDAISGPRYEAALEDVRSREIEPASALSLREELLSQAEEYFDITRPPAPGAEDLPFAVLDVDIDRDGDGLSDVDELRIGTELNEVDSDGDGFIDGLEVVNSYNPTVESPNDIIVHSFPAPGQGELATPYKVTGVRLAQRAGGTVLIVTGEGPANSLVRIMITSDPIVLFARVDETGRFLLESEDGLDFGPHTVVVADVSADGSISEVSRPVQFMLDANGITILSENIDTAATAQDVTIELVSWWERWRWLLVVAGGVLVVTILLVIFSLFRRSRLKIEHVRDSRNLEQG